MRKLGGAISGYLVVLILVLSFSAVICVRADTGTYSLSSQNVDLWVQTDGNVLIRYDIGMMVHSGSIPWVTVGLPTSNYEILSFNGTASSVLPQNSGSWSGVYISLDKTYYANQNFSFSFEVLQKEFIYKYNDQQASFQFTPCWWDNAVVQQMNVTVHLPPEIHSVTTTSEPTLFLNSSVVWSWINIPAGEKKTTGMLMPLSAFSHVNNGQGIFDVFSVVGWVFLVLFILVAVVVVLAVFLRVGSRSTYEDPQLYAGGFRRFIKHINLNCPNDGTRLERRSYHGTTIDFCDTCGGNFFDKGEVEALLEAGVNEQEFNTKKVISFRDYSSPVGTCPRCDGKMETVTRTSEYKDYHIYVCQECRGIWMNKNIYQAIKDKRVEQDEQQQKRLVVAGEKESDKKKAYYAPSWWWFYPYIFYPHQYQKQLAPSIPIQHSCACVSCACVSSCACACACAGGGAAGCAPKDTLYPQILFDSEKRKEKG
jgi:Zn-finger nucleic acid-binding protein